MPTTDPTPAHSRGAHEEYLRSLGLPLMVDPMSRLRETPRRSAGVSAGLAVALIGTAALDKSNDLAIDRLDRLGAESPDLEVDSWTDPILILLLLAIALVAVAPAVGWTISHLLRRRSTPVGVVGGITAGLVLLLGPVLAFDPHDGPPLWATASLLAAVLLGTHFGVGTLLRWSGRRVGRELGTMGPMVARVLPVLLLAILFFFYNAEIWQVMIWLTWPRTWAVVATVVTLAVVLLVVSTTDDMRRALEDHDSPVRLRRAERLNIVIVPVLAGLIQAALFAVAVFGFFLYLGWLSVPDATVSRWTGEPVDRMEGLLAAMPLSPTLVRVSLTLAAFSALNLVAIAATDPVHRARFVQPMLDEAVDGLAARETYLRVRRAAREPGKSGR